MPKISFTREVCERDVVRTRVESETKPGTFYHVGLYAECTCNSAKYRGPNCKHTKYVLDHITEYTS